MNAVVDNEPQNTPYVALVDDDTHSARLLSRMLLAHGSPRIESFSGAEDAGERLIPVLRYGAPNRPTLIIIDLKAHSGANLEFVARLAPIAAKFGICVVVMAQQLDRDRAEALHDAGAAAIFTRHADIAAYRREAANIVSFWARSQRLEAVGM